MRTLLPEGWPRPKGYANGIEAEGRLVFVAGQIGWTPDGRFEATTLATQFAQTLDNTLAVLREAKAGPEHIARMTWYITDKRAYLVALAEIGAVWREKMGRNYPAMAVVEVKALIEDAAMIEIETTAVVPNTAPRP
jgi:enamine deaminase RidA (YjgF/YER057c/UK114 family)